MRTLSVKPLALAASIAIHLCLSSIFGAEGIRSSMNMSSHQTGNPTLQVYIKTVLPDTALVLAPTPSTAVSTPVITSTTKNTLVLEAHAPIANEPPLDVSGLLTNLGYGDETWLSLVDLTPSRYYLPNELTEKPQVIEDIPTDNIRFLPDLGIRTVIAKLLIDENGRVEDILLEDSALSSQAKSFITDSFAGLKFEPGKLGMLPVKSQLNIEVTLDYAAPKVVPVSVSQLR